MKNSVHRLPGFLCLILWAILLSSCAVGNRYQDKAVEINNFMVDKDFAAAADAIDQNKFLSKDRNRLLYLFEKGKLKHMNGEYEESNQLFEQAYVMIDDGIKNDVGNVIGSKLVSPMSEVYKGEDFEKVMIHYYMALNYFYLGQTQEALVEAKRIDIKLHELNNKYKENKNKYTQDAFAQILQGVLYEATGDINNAFIAYRNAADIYMDNGNLYFGVPFPEQLKKDLLRTSKIMGFGEEYAHYKEQFPEVVEDDLTEATAVVFWENGQGPQKGQIKLSASGVGGVFVATYDDGEDDLIIPIPAAINIGFNAIAIPKYEQRQSYYQSASLITDTDREIPFNLSENFFYIAKQSLRDRMLRETADVIVRFATKKVAAKGLGSLVKQFAPSYVGEIAEAGANAAGALLEAADTRNWQSLPATISYARVPLQQKDENIFKIRKVGSLGIDYDTLSIPYKKGLQVVSYFDIGRATSDLMRYEVAHTEQQIDDNQ